MRNVQKLLRRVKRKDNPYGGGYLFSRLLDHLGVDSERYLDSLPTNGRNVHKVLNHILHASNANGKLIPTFTMGEGSKQDAGMMLVDEDSDKANYLAAWAGLMMNSDCSGVFTPTPNGNYLLVELHVPNTPVEEVETVLSAAGVREKNYITTQKGINVVWVAVNGAVIQQLLHELGERLNAVSTTTPGEFSSFGGRTEAENRKEYRSIIRKFESVNNSQFREYEDYPDEPESTVSVKAPAGGAVVDGIYYKGGKNLPKEAATPTPQLPVWLLDIAKEVLNGMGNQG